MSAPTGVKAVCPDVGPNVELIDALTAWTLIVSFIQLVDGKESPPPHAHTHTRTHTLPTEVVLRHFPNAESGPCPAGPCFHRNRGSPE